MKRFAAPALAVAITLTVAALVSRPGKPTLQPDVSGPEAPASARAAESPIRTGPAGAMRQEPAQEDCCPGLIQAANPGQPTGSITEPPKVAKPASTKAFDDFRAWAERYREAAPEQKAQLAAEGLRLAQTRNEAFAGLIRFDPKTAIETLLPYALRKGLPPEIAEKIEHPVRGRGPLNVLGVLPPPGGTVEEPIVRTAKVKDKDYRVYTYGKRLNQPTTPDTRILGVAVELPDGKRLLALREEPYEVLPKDEAADIKAAEGVANAVCPVSGDKTEARGDETAVDTGGEVVWMCSHGHIEQWLETPEGRVLMYAGGSGTSPGTSPIIPATHNQGNKKFLAIRVRFANQASNFEPASDATMQTELQNVVDKAAEWSYGKLQSTFKFSPVLTLSQTDTWYAANGAEDKLRADAFALAAAYVETDGSKPYDPAAFDFPCIVFSASFGNYCGLGTIGGNSAWIKCASASTFLHEWGHNFGLLHANLWQPSTDSPIGPGQHVEYGSRYSPMGGGWVSYNTVERYTLGWLTDSDVGVVSSGGVYRLYNADKTTLTAGHPYSLRIRQKGSRFYFVEYRPNFREDGAHEANTDNGALIAWTDNGSQLLDMTPLSSGGVNDASLLIGRTFRDPGQGIYITPIAKGGAAPDDYLDVAVNYEAGAANAAPVAVVTASNLAPAVNASVTLNAIASDLDGDALAYSWEFGDGSFSTDNAPTVAKSWSAAGAYQVRCTVSDRRGKSVSRSLLIRVGAPSTLTISGKVTAAGGAGVPDVLMRVDADHFAYTDSDGRYAITRLNAGSYTVQALHDGWTLSAQFTNPVAIASDASGIDFLAAAAPSYGGVSGEMWTGISGTSVSNLTGAASYQSGAPNYRFLLSDALEAPEGIADNYGQRLRGFFKAPSTGAYTFYIASDDSSELWLSTSENPSAKSRIAYVNGAVGSRNYTAQSTQKSSAVNLTAGSRYYVEVLHKEGGGGDHVSVGVDLPGGSQQRPIPASYLDPYYTAALPAPANAVTVAANTASISEAGGSSAFTLTRTGSTASPLTVAFNIGGAATYGADYQATGLTATFAAGAATASVPLTAIEDALAEPAEAVTLTLSPAPALYTVGSSASATITIEDNEAPQVTITAADGNADESGSNPGAFLITRTGSTASALTVNYSIGGSASNGSDYPTLGTSVTIPAGQSTATIPINPIADGLLEVAETVTLTIGAGSGYAAGSPNTATVTIAAATGTGGGILREWWDNIGNSNFVSDLTNLGAFPASPTGREIVTTAFTTGQDRADSYGERWRALFTAPVTGSYTFYIASDDYSELWLSADATPERRQKIAYVNGATGFQAWTQYASQKSAAIALTAGQRYYIEAVFKEGVGGDHMSVGVDYPNGAQERPIPAHRFDPFPAATPLPGAWTSTDVGNAGSPGSGGLLATQLPAGPKNRYSFSGTASAAIASGATLTDSVGGASAALRGAGATFTAGGDGVDLPGGSSATQAYIDLPNGVITGAYGGGTRYSSATYEAWVTVQTAQSWSRLMEFGVSSAGEVAGPGGSFDSGSTQDVLLTAGEDSSHSLDQQLARWGGNGPTQGRQRDSSSSMVLNTQIHIALVYDNADKNWRWYRNGVLMQVLPDNEGLSTLNDVNNWLGRSGWSGDQNTDAVYNEFRIYNYALTEAQVRGNFAAGPDVVNTLDSGGSGPYFLTGSGALSTNGLSDGFHFESQAVSGDLDVSARLASITSAGPDAMAGLMIREGSAATARHAFIGLTPGGTARFISRVALGRNASTAETAGLSLPEWIRLTRRGDCLSAFVSPDGATWTQVGSTVTLAGLSSSVQVGFAAASGAAVNASAVAQFDSFRLSPLPGGGDGFLYERFDGITGTAVSSLTSAAAYPNSPSVREIRSGLLDVPQSSPNLDNFGQRLRGYFTAPLTGAYTFYLAGDDGSELWLSTSEAPAGRVRIVNVTGATGYREWTKSSAQKSAPVTLAAGQRYYLEILNKEGGGNDHLSVGVTLPNGTAEFPMSASRITAYELPESLPGAWTSSDVGAPSVAGAAAAFVSSGAGAGEPLPKGPRHRYSFNGTANAAVGAGSTIVDSVSGQHATLQGAGAAFDASGAGLSLPGGSSTTQAYVDLPNGIATGTINGGTRYSSVSYELWYAQRSSRTWCRLLDFGTGSAGEVTGPGGSFSGTNYITLIGNVAGAADQRLDRTSSAQRSTTDSYGAAVLNQLVHAVVSYDAASAAWRWYENGVLVATLPDSGGLAALTDVNNWLGRSNYNADQNFDGVLHEFRIYDYALTPQQVAGNLENGPDLVNTLGAPLPKPPRHRWTFDGAAGQAAPDGVWIEDRVGGADALVRGAGAAFSANGGGLTLPGGSSATQAYVDLPNGVASGTYGGGARFASVTYEFWAQQDSHQNWSRIFDFGTGTAGEITGPGGSASGTNFLHLTGNSGLAPTALFRRKATSTDAQASVTGATALGQLAHFVVEYSAAAQEWRWYRNGALLAKVADTDGVSTLADVNNWLGRSQYTADSNWAGTMYELRIYDYALTEAQLQANLASGPDALNVAANSAAGTVLVSGGGDISSTGAADNFQFASQPMDGDGEIVARLVALQNVNTSAKAGVMLRESTASGSRHAFIGLTPGGNGRYTVRTTTGGNASAVTFSGVSQPYWVRLVRLGNTVTGYVSADGATWTQSGTTTFSGLASDLLAGLAVSSSNTGVADATFDHVQILRPTVTVSVTQNAVEYPPVNGVVTVARTWDTSAPLTVSYKVGGSATPGADYQTASGTVTIPAGQKSASITIAPLNDAAAESPESVIVTLIDAAGYVLGAPSSAAVTLVGAETPSESWLQTNFGANWNNDAVSGDAADPDRDGVPNLLERALGGNPNAPDAGPRVTQSLAGSKLALTFSRNTANTDLVVTVQGADSAAGPWTDLARSAGGGAFTALVSGVNVSETGAGAVRTVEVRDAYLSTDPTHPRRFLRVQVQH